jgi:acetyltransferase
MTAAILIRPIRPADEAAMVTFHGELSDATVYARYFEVLGLPARTAHERLTRICHDDDPRDIALVAELKEGDQAARIVAVGRLSLDDTERDGEFAIVVADRWQRQGIGSRLLEQLVQIGRERSLDRIWADILPANVGMRRTARSAGFTITDTLGAPTVRAEQLLTS